MDKEIKDMKELIKGTLIPLFSSASQLGRSFSKDKRPNNFNKELVKSINHLRRKVDKNTIKNRDIRNNIKKLSNITGASIGQSQKVINVYLKYYCLTKDCPVEVIKELDCPLDSNTMKKKQTMKNVLSMNEYVDWQNKFEKDGIRLLRDNEYDKQRMRSFRKKKHKKR